MAGFRGLNMGLGNLSRLSNAETRSISPENLTGEKGRGGMASEGTGSLCARDLGQGWKVSPSLRMPPHETLLLADIRGRAPSSISVSVGLVCQRGRPEAYHERLGRH